MSVAHEKTPPECQRPRGNTKQQWQCGTPSCPWCIVRRQRTLIDELTRVIREAHGSLVAVERALERAGMPAREEPKRKKGRAR